MPCARAATLRIGEAKAPPAKLLPESPVLGLQVLDDILLLAAHPSNQHEEEKLNRERDHDLDASAVKACK